jgi:two-component system chemotaxis sensor kinase CheA
MIARALAEGQDNVPDIAQQLTETTYAMARISDDLQDTIMKVRMVPVHTVFSRFPRLVRDLSRKSGKQVELITEGEETELDKSVGEEIGDPLVHLIRNSLDHGLEPEDERIAAGKNPKGHVWLRAYHKGNCVAIEVEDDGRGIDPEKMRLVGVKKGLVTAEEAKLLDDRQAVDLIFAPGFLRREDHRRPAEAWAWTWSDQHQEPKGNIRSTPRSARRATLTCLTLPSSTPSWQVGRTCTPSRWMPSAKRPRSKSSA